MHTLPRCLAAAVLALTAPRAAAGDPFTLEDAARLRWVTTATIAPSGDRVAYVFSVPRRPYLDEDGPSWTELWVAGPRKDGLHPFVFGDVNVSAVRFTPDGKSISFLAKRGKDAKTAVWAIPVDGGEARPLVRHEEDIQEYSWSPDGKRAAFLAVAPLDKTKKMLQDRGFKAEVFEEDFRSVRVWVTNVGDNAVATEARTLDLPGSASELHWSPVDSRLAVALAPTPLTDDLQMRRRIHLVDADSGAVLARVGHEGKLGKIAWSPDGKLLAFLGAEDLHDTSASRLKLGDPGGGPAREVLRGFEGDFVDFAWTGPSDLRVVIHAGVDSYLADFSRDGQQRRLLMPPGGPVLRGVSVSSDGKRTVLVADSPKHPAELFVLDAGAKAAVRWTDSNPWLSSLHLAPQEVVSFKARDGLELQGILVRPLDEVPGKRYPLILVVHGGPEAHDSNGWLTGYSRPDQYATAAGYAVFHPNYRGSTGRGVAFAKSSQGDPAGKEFDDLVDAVDHLVAAGLVDRDKVGITGGSYGGYASAWAATKLTDRFAAAVMAFGISDRTAKYGTTDIPDEEYLVHALEYPWEDWTLYRERSPLTYVAQARTPLLLLAGKDDPRVPPSQSMMLYRYLKVLGKAPVRLLLYPGEGHGNRKAAARLDYSMRLMQWMDHYLKGPGGALPPYDLPHDSARLSEAK